MILLRVGVTVAVLAVLATQADWTGMSARVAAIAPSLIAVGFLIKGFSVFFAGERWRLSVAAAGTAIRRWLSLRLMAIGLFFGQGLPGTVGGDVVRGFLTQRAGCPTPTVLLAFILDRGLALVACLLLVLAGLPYLPPTVVGAAMLMLGGLIAGLGFLLVVDRLPLPALAIVNTIRPHFVRLRHIILSKAALQGLVFAAAVHLSTIVAVFAYTTALNLPVTAANLFVVVPATILVSALPISINGWGIREGAYVFGLSLYGVGAAEAITVSLMIGFTDILVALPGGVLWLLSRDRIADVRSETLQP